MGQSGAGWRLCVAQGGGLAQGGRQRAKRVAGHAEQMSGCDAHGRPRAACESQFI